jgi:hypothetical protein
LPAGALEFVEEWPHHARSTAKTFPYAEAHVETRINAYAADDPKFRKES